MVTKLSPKQIQKTILAPAMQQSIEVLLLPLADLEQAIEQQLQENPLLEVNEERSEKLAKEIQDELEKRLKIEEQCGETSYLGSHYDDEIVEDRPLKFIATLEESLLQQLRCELSCPFEQLIGELIIGNIDEDGFLKISVEEIAELTKTEDTQLIEKILSLIQTFEPFGIASRNLQECLSIQARNRYGNTNTYVNEIINHYLKELGQKKYTFLAKKLRTTLKEIQDAAKLISKLDPKPARNSRPISPNIYIKPDIFVTKGSDDSYHIHINDDGIPRLRISPFYKNMLQTGRLGPCEREFIREKIKNALHFMKSIEQRSQTIRSIANYILSKQRDFFDKGHMALTPMRLKDVAQEVHRNESTISRAINNKFIDTPRGTFPLKYFFSQEVCGKKSGGVTSRGIKEEIKDLIESENKSHPLSDSEIQKHFEERGMKIARRTISKYRQASRILPSHLRKQ